MPYETNVEVSEPGAYATAGPDEPTTAMAVVGPQPPANEILDPSQDNGMFGQNNQQGIGVSEAMGAMRKGTPALLERLSFGALADGTPTVSFKDENGTSQSIRLSAGQWMAAISGRDVARREMQFQLDNKRKREKHAGAFSNLIDNGDFSNIDQAALKMAWDINPDTAFSMMQKYDAVNREERQRTALYGSEYLGGETVDFMINSLGQRGITLPQTMRQSDWDKWLAFGMKVAMEDNKSILINGEYIPEVKALPHLMRAAQTDIGAQTFANAATKQLSQAGPDVTGLAFMNAQLSKLPGLANGQAYIGQPTAPMFETWKKQGNVSDNMQTLMVAARVRGDLANLEVGKLGEDIELDADLQKRLLTIGDNMAEQLGWPGAGGQDEESRTELAHELLNAAQKVNSLTSGEIRPMKSELQLKIEEEDRRAKLDIQRDEARHERIEATREARVAAAANATEQNDIDAILGEDGPSVIEGMSPELFSSSGERSAALEAPREVLLALRVALADPSELNEQGKQAHANAQARMQLDKLTDEERRFILSLPVPPSHRSTVAAEE